MSSNPEVSKRKLNSSNSNRSSVETITKEHLSSSIFQSDSLIQSIISGYKARTSAECKSIDAFLAFTVCTGMAQLVYCSATGGFPYNAFIGVFAASIGSFVFAANARLQCSKKSNTSNVEKAHLITEFLVCSILLNVFVANFIG